MKNLSFSRIEIKNFTLIVLISFHIFFWDIKFLNNFGLRELLVISSFFFLSELNNNNFSFSLVRKVLYFKIFLIIFFIFLHLILNTTSDDLKFDTISILGFFGFVFLFLFVENYYNFIRKNLDKISLFFLICLIISIFFSGIKITTEWEKENLGHCIFFFKFSNLIFKENSHLAMVLPAAIGYLFLISDKIKNKYIYSIIFCIFFVLQNSMTLTVSTLILFFLIIIFERKEIKYLLPGLILFLLLFLAKIIFEEHKGSCFQKLNTTVQAVVDTSLKKNIFDYDIKKSETYEDNKYFFNGDIVYTLPDIQYKFYSGDGREIKKNEKNLFVDFIPKNKAFHELPRISYDKLFNLSTAVLINSINISIKTLEDRILGWGLNRYERAFDYYMFNTIVLPPFYHEIFTLNYNDGSSNLTKSITEFGIISFIFIPLIFFFFFTDKVNKYEKIFFLTIIFTQVLRGAGYFNGGFAFSIIFIILTYLKKNEN